MLADRLAIIAEGQIVATGTADELIGARSATSRIRFRLRDGMAPPDDLGATRSVDAWELETDRPAPVLHRLTGWSMEAGAELLNLEVSRPSLEEVYLQLTAEETGLE
jgi:ABC-2 type transport system ATP-binding protein